MKNLNEEMQYILDNGFKLKDKYDHVKELTFDYLNVFSSTSEEYDNLIEQALSQADEKKEHSKGSFFILKNKIKFQNIEVSVFQITKPRNDRKDRGYLSFVLNDFEKLKDDFDHSEDSILTQKQNYLRMELFNRETKVLVYLTSKSLEQIIKENFENKEFEKQNKFNREQELTIDLDNEKSKRLQLMADFQNYQKRIESEKASWGAIANMSLIQDILEVYDDMQLAMQDENLNLESAKSSIITAQEKIVVAIQRSGIEKVDVKVGENFDKEKMEAVSAIPVENELQKNKVIAVMSSAYKYKNKEHVLKAAKVVIGK